MDEDFNHMMSQQYGHLESQLGQSLYEANTQAAKSVAARATAQASLFNAFAIVVWFIGIVSLPPLAVFLWRWALG